MSRSSYYTRTLQWALRILLFAATLAPAAIEAGSRAMLEKTVLALAAKEFVAGEDRPRSDGVVDYARIAGEMRALSACVPRWDEAMRLHAEDSKHPHTIGEHGLRALYFYARSPHAAAVRADSRRYFLDCLTALLHDMGKLDSPRSKAGRQASDAQHPALCARYIRRHADALGLDSGEAAWVANILEHHRDLGVLERTLREPTWVRPAQAVLWRRALARDLRTRFNVDYLAALTEADVRAINGSAYDDWNLRQLLPLAFRSVVQDLPAR
ncbi:MAG: hypothetical protein HY303_00475 [Candidatus Wallbacteria bacterium]|nr:hypothetical protein [Candidatus Wallbacteria bacterium]